MQVDTFELSEALTGLLHEEDGLSRALTQRIAELNLPMTEEHVLFALLGAQARCRELAMQEAARLVTAHRG